MIDKSLALALRPQSFDALIGAEKVVKRIRARVKSHRTPKAWLFSGGTGSGKTTLARILAASILCTHQEVFGNPCKRCYRGLKRGAFDYVEVPPAKYSSENMRDIISAATNYPRPGSKRRIYLFDEFHRASQPAMDLLLKPFEDCPRTTVFIICTSEPDRVLRTVRRRCARYPMQELDLEGVTNVARMGLEAVESELAVSDLADALYEKNVTSPGLVLNAVESYADGKTAIEAAEMEAESAIDNLALWASIRKADWKSAAEVLDNLKPDDVRAIQGGITRLMQKTLLKENDFSKRTQILAKSIIKLSDLQGSDAVQISALTAILYQLCVYFERYKR